MIGRVPEAWLAPLRRFAQSEEGVSEVVGYLLTFSIAVVLLVAALQTFAVVRDYSQDLAAHSLSEDVGNRIAYAVLQAADAGQQLPGVEYDYRVHLPTGVAGRPFRVELTASAVYVNETGDRGFTNATVPLFNAPRNLMLCRGPATVLSEGTCFLPGGLRDVTVSYGTTLDTSQALVRGVFFRTTGG